MICHMIIFTDSAMAEIRRRFQQESWAQAGVRISLEEGGCAGTSYVLDLGRAPAAEDRLFSRDEFTVAVDSQAMPLLKGLEVDFVDSLVGGGFRFRNPNAGRSCGCGASFSPLG